jgi:hypothetical protein
LSSQAQPNFYVGYRLTIGYWLHDLLEVGAGAVFGEKRDRLIVPASLIEVEGN